MILRLEARSERLEASLKKVQGDLKRTHADMAKLGSSTAGIERQVIGGFQRMGASIGGLHSVGERARQMLNGMVAAAAAFGAVRIVQQTLQLGDALGDMAQQTGVSVEALQRLRFVAAQNGASVELLDRSLNVLNERLGEAASGSKEAQQAFANLGFRWQDLQQAGTEQAFLAIADALGNFPDAADRASRMADVFGARSRAMANTMALGSTGIVRMGHDLDALGATLSTAMVQRLGEANDQLDKLWTVLQAKVAIALADLSPKITAAVDSILRMVQAFTATHTAVDGLTEREAAVVHTLKAIQQAATDLAGPLADAAGLFGTLVSKAIEGFKNLSDNLKLKPIGDQIEALDVQIRQLEQNLEVLGRQPAESRTAALEQQTARLKDLLTQRQRLNEQALAFMQGGEPDKPIQLPPVVIEGQREPPPPLRPPPRAPFKIDTPGEDQAKRLADVEKKFAESQRQMEGWAAVLRSLGQPVDLTNEKIALLTQTIKERLALDVPVASARVQDLTQALGALQQEAAASVARLEGMEGLDVLGEWPDITPIQRELTQQLDLLDQKVKVFGASNETATERLDRYRQALETALAEGVLPYDQGLQRLKVRYDALTATARLAELQALHTQEALQTWVAYEATHRQRGDAMTQEFQAPIERLRQTRAELEATLAVMGERWRPTFDKALQQSQIEFGRTTAVGQGLAIVAQGITEAFDQSFQGIIQGTLTVSEAFRNMAASILLSINKILLQKGVEALLSVAFSALGAGAGAQVGSQTSLVGAPTGGQGSAAFPILMQQRGGLVPGSRAAPPDSVPSMLTPGEFVLRKSAAQALGPELLHRLNRFQRGGLVLGSRAAPPDSVPGMLSPGEFVIRRGAVDALGKDMLDRLNRFQHGGMVPEGRAAPSGRVPEIVSPGASIIRRGAVDALGPEILHRRNRLQHGGLVPGSQTAAPDSVQALLTPGEFVLRKSAAQALGPELLQRLNTVQRFQEGGAVSMPPMPAGVAMTRTQEPRAPAPVLHVHNIVVRSDEEAQMKRQELDQLDGHIVNVIHRQLLAGDGSLINRSIRLVHQR